MSFEIDYKDNGEWQTTLLVNLIKLKTETALYCQTVMWISCTYPYGNCCTRLWQKPLLELYGLTFLDLCIMCVVS